MNQLLNCKTQFLRLSMILVLCMLVSVISRANEQRRVKLDDAHHKETVKLPFCNIFVVKEDGDNDAEGKVAIEIENLDESNIIILFGHAYPEKELKKFSPSIVYDKNYPGTKGRRNIDTYKDVRNVIFIEPSEKKKLPDVKVEDGVLTTCRLPLYIAKYKENSFMGLTNGSGKLLLMEKQIVELELDVSLKPDEDFLRIDDECSKLIEEISKQVFCTNSKHRPTLDRQERPYKMRVEKLQKNIDEAIARRHLNSEDRAFLRYDGLKQKLRNIDFADYERDCGRRHGGGGGTQQATGCKYCNWNPQQIYHKLDDYYIMVYNSNNRKAAKERIMSDVNLLYGCSKHSAAWRNSSYQERIIDRYNRISNF